MSRSARWHAALGVALAYGALVWLASCAVPDQPPEPPDPPEAVTATAQLAPVKLLVFEWSGGEGATQFRVSRLVDGSPVVLADGIEASETSYELEVFLPDQVGALYAVEGCNAGGCTASPSIQLEKESLDAAIGYLKAHVPGKSDYFGASVALSADGEVLAIGAPAEDGGAAGIDQPVDDTLVDSGAVYVYTRTTNGLWSGPVYVKAPVPGSFDGFGHAVALSADGSVLAVGSPFENGSGTGVNPPHNDSMGDAGAVFLFERAESGEWSASAYLKASNPDTNDVFGHAISLSDDGRVLAVGASSEDGGGAGVNPPADDSLEGSGAAYVFERTTAGVWQQTAYVKADQPGTWDNFGHSVALAGDGNVLAVGGIGESGSGSGVDPPVDDALGYSGAVWVFRRVAPGQWAFDAYLKASNPGAFDFFGHSVSLSFDGSLLAAGAMNEDGGGTDIDPLPDESAPDTWAVYVFARDTAGSWTGPVYVKPGGGVPGATFGYSLAVSADGTALLVGALTEGLGGTGVDAVPGSPAQSSGSAWLYRLQAGSGWSHGTRIKASNTQAGDWFGFSVAISGDAGVMAVGARFEDGGGTGVGASQNDNSLAEAGAVYLY